MKKLALLCAALLLPVMLSAQAVLPQPVLERLQGSVFEVVTKKIETDPAEYEKELPWDRVPFAIRNDTYNPIGTAFLMDDGKLYTAAHVLQLTDKLLQDEFYIRDVNGIVWEIDKILKFATDRDFVIFTAKNFNPAASIGLHANRALALNSSIFTVGNAQGEGIVIRNGMFTSQTPEDQNGEWKWLRFSAAASPGNSGGPLIDADGNVVGIITMKNETENLNYALPVAEIDAVPDNSGRIRSVAYYTLPNLSKEKFYHKYAFDFTLPMTIKTLRADCFAKMQQDTQKLVKQISADYLFTGEKSFTKTDKTNSLNYSSMAPKFPSIIWLMENQKWTAGYPKVNAFELEENGYVCYGSFGSFQVAYIQKPESVSEKDLITNPKRYMDYLLQADPFARAVGSEHIKLTSLGKPSSTSSHTDSLGRTWLISMYDIPWVDGTMISMALPLPGGIFVIYNLDVANSIYNGWNFDLEYLSNFVLPSYVATVKDWKEYLSLAESIYPRHELLRGAKLSVDKKQVHLTFGAFSYTIPAEVLQAGNDDDRVSLFYTNVSDKTRGIRQAVSGITYNANNRTDNYHYFCIRRENRPPEGSPKTTMEKWLQIHNQQYPYNGEIHDDDQYTECYFTENVKDGSVDFVNITLKGNGRKDDMAVFRDAIKTVLHTN